MLSSNKIFFSLNCFLYYIELNSYLIGTLLSFFKYKFNSFYFFFIDNCIFYFYNYSLFFMNIWKECRYKFFTFISTHLLYSIKHLKLEGRGYKLYYFSNCIIFKLGYSHLCYFLLPLSVYFYSRQKKSFFRMVSFSSFTIGNLLFRMKSFRIPNKYKKKGIFIV